VTFTVYGALGAALFLLPIELQQVSGYTAVHAGIALLPATAIMLALSAPRGACRPDRTASADERRTGHHRDRPGDVRSHRPFRGLPHRGPACGDDLRPGTGHHRRPADLNCPRRRSR
jgi:hypothetical protein